MDANQIATAGFYFTNPSDIVQCDFCGLEIAYWTDGDVALQEDQRWRPCCKFIKGLCVGNIPILSNDQPEKTSQQPTRSQYLCGLQFKLKPNSI